MKGVDSLATCSVDDILDQIPYCERFLHFALLLFPPPRGNSYGLFRYTFELSQWTTAQLPDRFFFYESFLIQHRRTEKALTNFLAPFPAPWFLVFLVVLSRVPRPLVFYVTQSFLV